MLKVCLASLRTSLQGLDYFSSDGCKAFDEITEVVEKLGENCEGLSWAKEQERKLKLAKRYLKGDFKVKLLRTKTFFRSAIVRRHCSPLYIAAIK